MSDETKKIYDIGRVLIVDEIHSLLIFSHTPPPPTPPLQKKEEEKIEALKLQFMCCMLMLVSFNANMTVSGLICVHVSQSKILCNFIDIIFTIILRIFELVE